MRTIFSKYFLRMIDSKTIYYTMGSQPGGNSPPGGNFVFARGGILYLEFCLRCNIVEACNIVASSSVSLLIVFSQVAM